MNNKKLRFALLTLLCAVFSLTWADEVTFVAGEQTSTAKTITNGDFQIVLSDGTLSRTDNYRCYAGATMTVSPVSGKAHTITKVAITCTASGSSNYGPGQFTLNSTEGKYTYSGSVGTWAGSASEVVLKAAAQVRMTKIVITYTPAGDPNLKNMTVAFAESAVKVAPGADFTAPTLSVKDEAGQEMNADDYVVEYSTESELVLLDENTGDVVIGDNEGEAVINVLVVADGYNDQTASYTINIVAPFEGEGLLFSKVTDSKFAVGDKLIIVNEASKKAMSKNNNASNVKETAEQYVTDEDGNIVAAEDFGVLTLEASGDADYPWLLKIGDAYLGAAASGTSNYMYFVTDAEVPARCYASITVTNGDAVIYFGKAGGSKKWVRYNKSSKIFSCYTESNQNAVQLYRVPAEEEAPETVTISIKEGFDGTTYSGKYALDFTGVEAVAYKAVEKKTDVVKLVSLDVVPAETGIVVLGTAGDYEIPVAAADAELSDVEGNLLVANIDAAYTVSADDEGYVYRYVKGKTSGQTGFQQAKEGQTVSAGKAYLRLPAQSNAQTLTLEFDGVTAIEGLTPARNADNGAMYNLAGQRVNADYKGVVIVNGKKFVK